MSKYEKKEVGAAPAYTKADYDEVRAGIKSFVTERRGKHLFTAFQQFLERKGVVSFDEQYGVSVIVPLEYTRYNDIRAKIDNYDDVQLKEVLESMPEERAAWRKKIDALFKDWRESRARMKVI